MKRFLLLLPALLLLAATPVQAEKIKYYEDPVYKPLNDGDSHPMSDLMALAEGGDARAQFILGDLYAKGKGGLAKNVSKGGYWFEESAKAGYGPAFIRLGALAKNNKDPVAAWSWYDLGGDLARGGDARYARKARDEVAKKLTTEQISTARDMAGDWKQRRSQEISEKKAADKKKAEEDAAKAKAEDTGEKKTPAADKAKAATETPVVKEKKLNE